MNLDTFLISLLFDDKQTKNSADKIDKIVGNLTKSIQQGLAGLASFDFLKGAVDNFKNLSTEVDNLNYVTGESTTAIITFGEAVKRNGGTMQGALGFLRDFSTKMREVLYSTSAGQIAPFLKAGLSVNDLTSGNLDKVLNNLSNTFSRLNGNRQLQLRLGEMLGIDPTIVRTLAEGNDQLAKTKQRLQELGLTNQINVKTGIEFRNAMYNLNLVIEAMKNKLAQLLIPFLNKFSDVATKVIDFFNHNGALMESVLITIGTVVAANLIPTFIRWIALFNPFKSWGLILAGVVLVLQDFITWLHGGNAEFGKFYTWIFGSRQGAEQFIQTLLKYAPTLAKVAVGIYALIQAFKILRVAIAVIDALSLLNPIGLVVAGITAAVLAGYYAWEKWGGSVKKAYENFKNGIGRVYNSIFGGNKGTPTPQPTNNGYIPSVTAYSNPSGGDKATNKAIIINEAIRQGFDPNQALAIGNIESGLNASAQARGSTAGGLFQLINSTAIANGLDPRNKYNASLNAQAGIRNLKSTSDALRKFLGRSATGAELYLGEMLGLTGAERVLGASSNTPLANLLSSKVISGNNFQGLTAGDLRARANSIYNNSSRAVSVNVGNLNVHSPSSNPTEVGKQVAQQLSTHVNIINNYENGRVI